MRVRVGFCCSVALSSIVRLFLCVCEPAIVAFPARERLCLGERVGQSIEQCVCVCEPDVQRQCVDVPGGVRFSLAA